MAGEVAKPPEAPCHVGLCLHAARLRGLSITGKEGHPPKMLGLIQLDGLVVDGTVELSNLELGRESGKLDRATLDARELQAGVVKMTGLRPAPSPDDPKERRELSFDLGNAVLEELTMTDCEINGALKARSLTCRGSVILGVSAVAKVDLSSATVGGSLVLSSLRIKASESGACLILKGAQIAHTLRLAREAGSGFEIEAGSSEPDRSEPHVDLSDVSCQMLDDQGGRLWGSDIFIRMDSFTYAAATWGPERGRKVGVLQRFSDWLASKQAEARWWPLSAAQREELESRDQIWQPWQVRRNWIYQQFKRKPGLLSPSQHQIRGFEYRPQSFEQAIRVARAEGHDEFASQFEMLKQRIEWRLFNRRHRWWLGGLGITASAAWLAVQGGWAHLFYIMPGLVLILTLMVMIPEAWEDMDDKGWSTGARVCLVALPFALVVLMLFYGGGWHGNPLQFAIAAFVFAFVRLIAWLSDLTMRCMFGYLRRPVRAIGTLIGAFVIGWVGVAAANQAGMLVVASVPISAIAGAAGDKAADRLVMLVPTVEDEPGFVPNIPCGGEINPALYALDVMIPLIDLRQESRCEVGRAFDRRRREIPGPVDQRTDAFPETSRLWMWPLLLWEQLASLPQRVGFWAVLKAFYAIAGWLIVSLSILTFANIHRGSAVGP